MEIETYVIIASWILSFFIYSAAGWIWESIFCSYANQRHFQNRGFLIGPWIPIYGSGAITVNLLFSSHEKLYSIFLEGAVVACLIEYVTSWAMEAIYHRRWWDYSRMKFNLNGRVCLGGFIIFGLFSVISVCFVQPRLFEALVTRDGMRLVIASTILATLFATDFTVTVIHMAHLQERLDQLSAQLKREAKLLRIELQDNRFNTKNLAAILEARRRTGLAISMPKKYIESRLLKSFPELLNELKKFDRH